MRAKKAEPRRTKLVDPVLPDQGGRSTPADPLDGPHMSREQAIRRRAYEIYLQHGKEEGHAVDHWLAAETQITHAQR